MARTKQKADESTGNEAPRDLLARLSTRKAVDSSRIIRRNEELLMSHDSSDQVLLSDSEMYFRAPQNRHMKSSLWDLCGHTDVEKLFS